MFFLFHGNLSQFPLAGYNMQKKEPNMPKPAIEMLVNHADPEGCGIVGVMDLYFLPPDFNDTPIRFVEAEKNGHESGLACAVFTQKGMNLPFIHPEINPVICHNAGENFGNVQHLNGGLGHKQLLSFRFLKILGIII